MKMRRLGGLEVSAIGLGCMGMSTAYGIPDDAESVATIHRALDLGVTLLDTADVYGPHTNEELVGRAIRGRRDRVVLATKCGIVRHPTDPMGLGVNGNPAYIRSACDASLRRLGVETIDLYQLHRVDPQVPIEDSVGALADLVRAGKTRFIGLSEATAPILRRAHAVHPLASVQSEYSLWARDWEEDVFQVCRTLGIGFLAYSPLGRGLFTARLKRMDNLPKNDFRRRAPRFSEENFEKNLALVRRIEEMASAKGCTPAQLVLAWVLARGDFIVPIPGTKRRTYLEEDLGALSVSLSPEDVAQLDAAFPHGVAAGSRYPERLMQSVNR